MSGHAIISAWVDRHGRVWLDTGHVHPKTGRPIIELLNGEARGSLPWVDHEFGPLDEVGIQRTATGEDAP